MKFGIVVFPGSNCDSDAYWAASHNAKAEAIYLWHKDSEIPRDIDCLILPGGFSYGDYLRAGAIARFSPIMKEVINFANKGGYILGICNGFQILTEAGLLPGTLMKNKSLNFICKYVYLKTDNYNTAFTSQIPKNRILKIPIAHAEGNYYADKGIIDELLTNNQIVFRYCTEDGEIEERANPNGAMLNIAGIINKGGNIMGMMPHPERASENLLGSEDGLFIFNSLINIFK
ncbi:MAG TPA: phosphoribosylformylglycinamidine synthase subunit PurQ [Candidatus Kapabacteria bacterium]|nr:phosphoribosylformylglycinamidine synthase subunit PurQ [Candidatus Kapabacteria bacterium]